MATMQILLALFFGLSAHNVASQQGACVDKLDQVHGVGYCGRRAALCKADTKFRNSCKHTCQVCTMGASADDECFDLFDRVHGEGYCEMRATLCGTAGASFQQNCRRTCGECGGQNSQVSVEPEECKDKMPNGQCQQYLDFCDRENIQAVCMKSCNACPKTTEQVQGSSTSTPAASTENQAVPAAHRPSGCADELDKTFGAGHCQTHAKYCSDNLFRSACKYTCKACNGEAPPGKESVAEETCVDALNAQFGEGYCEQQAAFCHHESLRKNCQKSCGVCVSSVPPPPPICQDAYDEVHGEGYCEKQRQYCTTQILLENCRETCGLCLNKESIPSIEDPEQSRASESEIVVAPAASGAGCMNHCSHRGKCDTSALCQCNNGFEGADCSILAASHLRGRVFNNHSYAASPDEHTWKTASAACEGQGGVLTSIASAEVRLALCHCPPPPSLSSS